MSLQCALCGGEMYARRGRQKEYCARCENHLRRQREREKYRRLYAGGGELTPAAVCRQKGECAIEAVAALAAQRGVSYGKLVAEEYAKKHVRVTSGKG